MEMICKVHGLTKFYDGQRRRCVKCDIEYVNKRRIRVKELLVEYKGGKCERCGYDKCIAALEFHHIDPADKNYKIGSQAHTASLERMKKEVDKCILLCANCHREEHYLKTG